MSDILPYFGDHLPALAEAIVDIGAQLLEARRQSTDEAWDRAAGLKAVLSAIEAPSACLAVQRAIDTYRLKLLVTVASVQQPDPRLSRVPVDFQLWRYRGMDRTATPNAEAPPVEISQAVASIASRPTYSFSEWVSAAQDTAMFLSHNQHRNLANVMVCPPDKPESLSDLPWWDWLYRVQIAAALMIAHLGEGWQGSERRRVLLSLANGPVDWTVDAAIIAIASLATNDITVEEEATKLFYDLSVAAMKTSVGSNCYLLASLCATYTLPHFPADGKAYVMEQIQKVLQSRREGELSRKARRDKLTGA